MIHSILTVCSGNICRSPMAEALLARELGDSVQVSSAGVVALVGEPADPLAIELAREYGLDISNHRARQLTEPLLNQHELVLTMDNNHTEWITSRYSAGRGRVFLLGYWRDGLEILDPYGRDREAFEESFRFIQLACADWVARLGA